jgi:cytochrome c-type biogenesis protein
MAPMLAVNFKLAATSFFCGTLLLIAYGVGHCAVIVAAGTSAGLVQRFLNWNTLSRGLTTLRIVCGIVVMLGGVWLISSAP